MKKNFAMRIAACLLVVTMLSLCMVSYTYAKYTTADQDDNIAQVAAWGVNVDVELSDLFAGTYEAGNETVKAAGSYNLLAPGTTKTTVAAVKVSGTPEVSTEILPVVTVTLEDWEVDGVYYCPLEVTVGSTTLKGLDYTSASDFATAIKDAIEAAIKGTDPTGKYDPLEDLSAEIGTVNVEWEWPFYVSTDNDIKDTKLANAATKATFKLDIQVTINQVD